MQQVAEDYWPFGVACIVIALVRVKRDLLEALVKHGVAERIGLDRIYPTLPTAVAAYEQWSQAYR